MSPFDKADYAAKPATDVTADAAYRVALKSAVNTRHMDKRP
jgi:hypothetical protein